MTNVKIIKVDKYTVTLDYSNDRPPICVSRERAVQFGNISPVAITAFIILQKVYGR